MLNTHIAGELGGLCSPHYVWAHSHRGVVELGLSLLPVGKLEMEREERVIFVTAADVKRTLLMHLID